MKRLFLNFLFLSILSLSIQAQNVSELKARLQTELDQIKASYPTPGVTYSAVLPNDELIAIAAGKANIEKDIDMTPEHQMLGGSTGKVFYSVVIMQLVEEGKIDLDEPVSTYLGSYGWFKRLPNAEHLTMRALLRHESGIPRYVFKESFEKDLLKDVNKVWKPQDLLSYVFDDEPLFEVGAQFEYSDTNYIIACMVVEKVTGNDLYDEVKERVLKKAGLKYVEAQNKRSYSNLAQGYNDDGLLFKGEILDENNMSRYNLQFEWAGGGLVITSQDLAILAKKIYEGEMFDKALLTEYFNGRSAGQMGGNWGLGVHIIDSPHGKIYTHTGFMPGYVTIMMYFADHGFSICYQINGSVPKYQAIARDLPKLTAIIRESLQK